MNHYIEAANTYLLAHKKQLIAAAIILVTVAIFAVLGLLIQNSMKLTYEPTKACDLFTPNEAQELLHSDKVISTEKNAPVVSGDVATSKCSYTDTNPNANKMLVAAVAVRSAVYEAGIAQNKSEFVTAKTNNAGTIETVNDLGDSAYFNRVNGQLNVLRGRDWIILNYGAGSEPQANTLDKAVEFARKVLN